MPSASARSGSDRFPARSKTVRPGNRGPRCHRGSHRRGDGGPGRGQHRSPGHLRHGQSHRSSDEDKRDSSGFQTGWAERRVYPSRRSGLARTMSETGTEASKTACARICLRPGRDGPVRGGNPWIFSQAIARVEPAALAAGTRVKVCDCGGDLIGVGYYNPDTVIAVRMLAWGETPPLSEILARRIERASELRGRFVDGATNSFRLVNGDGDG